MTIVKHKIITPNHGELPCHKYVMDHQPLPKRWRGFDNAPKRIMVLDTETCSLKGDVYDLGYTIADKKGNIFITRNWLVKEVFTNGRKMKGAFFAAKMFNEYAVMLANKTVELTPWLKIVEYMRKDFHDYGVNVLAAYNLPFDLRVMTQTNKMLKGSTPILPTCLKLDLYRFAAMAKFSKPTYQRVARENGWVSKAGNVMTNAECAYKYCMQKFGFVEQHTALDDAIIETAIMARLFKTKSFIPYNDLRGNQWKIANC